MNDKKEQVSEEHKKLISQGLDTRFKAEVLVAHIDSFGKGLNAWEIGFIADLIDHPPKEYTSNMIKVIHRIYNEKC